eukprot:6924769-Pyramimonas_sp.AAC.1
MVACQTDSFVKLRPAMSSTGGQTYRSYSTHGPQKDEKTTTIRVSPRYVACLNIVTGRIRPMLSWSSSASWMSPE